MRKLLFLLSICTTFFFLTVSAETTCHMNVTNDDHPEIITEIMTQYQIAPYDISDATLLRLKYENGNLHVNLDNYLIAAYTGCALVVLRHDNIIHFHMWHILLDSYSDNRTMSGDFILHDIEPGKYHITFNKNCDLNPPAGDIRAIDIEMEMKEGNTRVACMDILNKDDILSTDREWTYCVPWVERILYKCRIENLGSSFNGVDYLDFRFVEGPEWNPDEAKTMAYVRREENRAYVLPADVELPATFWDASADGTVNPGRYPEEYLLVDFDADFTTTYFSYDAFNDRMEPMSPQYLKRSTKVEKPTHEGGYLVFSIPELYFRNHDRASWIWGVGAVGYAAGPFPYPTFFNSDPTQMVRLACVKQISTGKIIYQDRNLLAFNNISGVETINGADDTDTTRPLRYFNLQGIEVQEPTSPGIYIRYDGERTQKIVM